ncbi:hypothetical protein PR048_025715 [Dryococelus australis]|uniref:DUF4371 domain-containing protein n=1 Tax=Dryococelus australis TaxID=614101 RepID=A0ABQ9GJA7_9NEOP|nr:hypothetical protein PR048_025715 [Dryococelus australis]
MTRPPLTCATLATSQQLAQWWFGEAQKNKKGQSSLLSYVYPGPPPSKKQRSLEDEPPGVVLGSSPTQSSTSSNDNTFSKEGGCLQFIWPTINPVHGPALAIPHVKEGSFQPIDLLFPMKDGRNFGQNANFQNELLSIIEEQIKLQIGNEVRKSKVFTIITDETQDIPKHEEVPVVLRHVNENLEVHESFVGFYRVAARILEENPYCIAHVLNLCIVTCCTGATSIRNTFFVFQSLYNFIKKSTKENAVFEKIQRSTKTFGGGTVTLKSLSDTIWPCRVEAVRYLLDIFEATLSALQELSQTDPDSGGKANSLLKSMEDFKFVFDFLLLRRVLT